MSDPALKPYPHLSDQAVAGAEQLRKRARHFAIFSAVLLLAFARPLYDLFQLSLANELYSHVLLIPLISLYLVWLDHRKLTLNFEPAVPVAACLLLASALLLAAYWTASLTGRTLQGNDRLCLLVLALVLGFGSGFVWFLGRRLLRDLGFPLGFLIFMVPLPVFLENHIVSFLQHASADMSYLMLKISGMPVVREGTQFMMPGVSIAVAPECSGIRSSLVLLITGMLAAHFFLRRAWTRLILAVAVILLGIFRNSLRIFTLSQLAVRVNPDILNSSLHHHGGPLFFAISLAPFFLLLWFLRKCEAQKT